MNTYNPDILRSIKWLQNEAPGIISLINQKKEWIKENQRDFWENWEDLIFDVHVSDPFSNVIWCIILGIPLSLVDFGNSTAWAFGELRQNFKTEKKDPTDSDNQVGGNFSPMENAITSQKELRLLIRLRYLTLVHNGNLVFINQMLKYIFKDFLPWDIAKGQYVYLIDNTITPDSRLSNSSVQNRQLEYHFGSAMTLSGTFMNLIQDEKYAFLPQMAGMPLTVLKD